MSFVKENENKEFLFFNYFYEEMMSYGNFLNLSKIIKMNVLESCIGRKKAIG